MIQEEPLMPILQEVILLAAENGKEIYGDSYNPRVTTFADLAVQGFLRLFTVREDAKLVGYAMFIISPKLHQRLIVCADCSTIYLSKEYRGHMAGELVRFAETALKASGVHQIQYHARPVFKRFFKHLGYETSDYTYAKDV